MSVDPDPTYGECYECGGIGSHADDDKDCEECGGTGVDTSRNSG